MKGVWVPLAPMLLFGSAKGQECDTCSNDSDCDSPLICASFLGVHGQPLAKKRLRLGARHHEVPSALS
jgi:hypothetical protein